MYSILGDSMSLNVKHVTLRVLESRYVEYMTTTKFTHMHHMLP